MQCVFILCLLIYRNGQRYRHFIVVNASIHSLWQKLFYGCF